MGSFTVELYERQAPRTVQNFIGLAIKGYYDGTVVSGNRLSDLLECPCALPSACSLFPTCCSWS